MCGTTRHVTTFCRYSVIGVRRHTEYPINMNKCEGNASDESTQDSTAKDKDVIPDGSGGKIPKEVNGHNINQRITAVESFENTYRKEAPGNVSRSLLFLTLNSNFVC